MYLLKVKISKHKHVNGRWLLYKHNLSHSISIQTKKEGLMAYRGELLLLLLQGVTQAGKTARGDWRGESERES
ncbi:hypothetical protein ACB092_05G015100 [Castanea dentata]